MRNPGSCRSPTGSRSPSGGSSPTGGTFRPARLSAAGLRPRFAVPCEATWDLEPAAVAAALTRLTRAYNPAADYPPFPDDAFYGPRLRQLVVLRLRILRAQVKFKVSPPGADEGPGRRNLAAELRRRGGDGDARAADWIEHYDRLREAAATT